MREPPLPVCCTVPRLTKVVFAPVSVLTLVLEIVTKPLLVMTPRKVPPSHWKRLGGKSRMRFGFPVMLPLASATDPDPLPVISPAHVGALPPVRSSTAPAATSNTPLELVPPPLRYKVPLSTLITPPWLLKRSEERRVGKECRSRW